MSSFFMPIVIIFCIRDLSGIENDIVYPFSRKNCTVPEGHTINKLYALRNITQVFLIVTNLYLNSTYDYRNNKS